MYLIYKSEALNEFVLAPTTGLDCAEREFHDSPCKIVQVVQDFSLLVSIFI